MLKDIFTLKTDKEKFTDKTEHTESDNRREGETYAQWGTRWAGQTGASITALIPALQVVVCQQRREQQEDVRLQEDARMAKKQKIERLQAEISIEEGKIRDEESSIENFLSEIREKENEIIDVRGGGNRDKIAKINFWIGLVITVLLAVYLFIFYSSASFSAFFRDQDKIEVGSALFYPQAYGDAWNTSIGEFLLILLMPVVFLGLGFLIHQFSAKRSLDDNNRFVNELSKYLKILVLYIVTFIFDALLAYEISRKMYDAWVLNQLGGFPEYTWAKAFGEGDFWIIIFSGFIAYVIWGLVFDFTMDSYSDMTENRNLLAKLTRELKELKDGKNSANANILDYRNRIHNLRAEIASLEHELTSVAIDVSRIRQELNNFLRGWLGYMSLMAMPESRQEEARGALNDILEILENE